MQPPAVCGSRASKASLIVPIPFSFMLSETAQEFPRLRFVLRVHFPPRVKGPISHAQTVPW